MLSRLLLYIGSKAGHRPEPPPPIVRWEYRYEYLDSPSSLNWVAATNKLGIEGWELVQLLSSPYGDKEYSWGVFKRAC